MHLGWHITGDDRKYRIRRGLILASPYLMLAAGAYVMDRYGLYDPKWLVVGIGAFLILWIITLSVHQVFQYPNRSYELTEYGLTVSKGEKKRSYRWEEFRFFHQVGLRNLGDPIKRYMHGFNYQTIYLRKKANLFGFIRSYVVLYVPQDKLAELRYNLGVWVGEKKPGPFFDFGPTNFEFR